MDKENLAEIKLEILQVIQKHPGIPHRKLLDIFVNIKKKPAKKTVEKYLKELLEDRSVIFHKYGNEKQYFVAGHELSQNDLEKQLKLFITELQKEIIFLEKKIPKYDYDTKVRLSDYINKILKSFLELSGELTRGTSMFKYTDMSEEEAILDEIDVIIKEHKIDFRNPIYDHVTKSREICTTISKLKHDLVKHIEARKKKGISKQREELTNKIRKIDDKCSKLFHDLETHLVQLKLQVK